MEKDMVKRVIYSFFGKHFSTNAKQLFGAWLRAEGNAAEKEEALGQLWEDCRDASSPYTDSDWLALKEQLAPTPQKRMFNWRLLWKYAAVIALMAVSAWVTWMVKEKGMAEPPALMECFVPHGEQKEIVLPDGTNVWINSGSMLVYPQSFHRADTRTVYLTGEAGFNVVSDPEKPFIVQTAHLNVRALGTAFVVEAYLDEAETRATLEEGSICVDVQTEPEQSFVLKPHEQLVYSLISQKVDIRTVDAAQMERERSGYILFENATFSHIAHTLERRYGVSIQYEVGGYVDGRYNVKFSPRETLDDVMRVLAELLSVDYDIQEETVYVRKRK